MRDFLVILILAVCLQGQTNEKRQSAKDSLTGCVDERDGQYVLTNDTNLQPVARLQPETGSADDNFARHLGHKVTVTGKLSRDATPPTLMVRNIAVVSETCAVNQGTL